MARTSQSSPLLAREGLLKVVKSYRDDMRKFYPELVGTTYHAKQDFEEMITEGDFGMAPVVDESRSRTYDDFRTPYSKRYRVLMRAIGFQVTKQAKYVDLYGIVKRPSKKLALAMTQTKEQVVANVLINSTNTATTFLGPDGVPLLSTAHPTAIGTTSNRLATDAAFGYQSLADLIQLNGFIVSDRGNPAVVPGPYLVVGSYKNRDRMKRVVGSAMIADNANNSKNAAKDDIDSIHINPYLSSVQDYWWLIDKAMNPIFLMERIPMFSDEDYDMDDFVHKFGLAEEYIASFEDFRGVSGTTGAG